MPSPKHRYFFNILSVIHIFADIGPKTKNFDAKNWRFKSKVLDLNFSITH